MELPLYAHPSDPLSTEDQIKFANLFSSMEQYGAQENGFNDRISITRNTCSNAPNFHGFRDLMDVVPLELASSPVQDFMPSSSETDGAANRSESSHLQELSYGDRGALLSGEPTIEEQHSIGESHFAYGMRTKKVFPDKINCPCDDLDERENTEVKVKPSSARNINSSGNAPVNFTDGFRFLIVVI